MAKKRLNWRFTVGVSTSVGRWVAQRCHKKGWSYSGYIRELIRADHVRETGSGS